MACSFCKNNQSEYYRFHQAGYSHKEIFPSTPELLTSYDILKEKGTNWIIECLSCHSYWFISVKHSGGPVYTDFNRSDPRDTAPDSYVTEETEVEAKIIKKEEIKLYLK